MLDVGPVHVLPGERQVRVDGRASEAVTLFIPGSAAQLVRRELHVRGEYVAAVGDERRIEQRRNGQLDIRLGRKASVLRVIERALEKFHGNRRDTAEALKISAVTLWRKMKQYGLSGTS